MTTTLTEDQQDQALAIVARWLGPRMGYDDQAAPTGAHAARHALGPELNRAWDWAGSVRPTILLEGGPFDWAVDVSFDDDVVAALKAIGVAAEPFAGYALCLYPYAVIKIPPLDTPCPTA